MLNETLAEYLPGDRQKLDKGGSPSAHKMKCTPGSCLQLVANSLLNASMHFLPSAKGAFGASAAIYRLSHLVSNNLVLWSLLCMML